MFTEIQATDVFIRSLQALSAIDVYVAPDYELPPQNNLAHDIKMKKT
jgi:hypothetical protein